jgi:ribosomal peptide maturation radical SAM protein 1
MREPSAMLVAMPWHALDLPSIQLGILGSVLEQAGITTEVRSLMLAFMEHCLAETAGRPEGERIELADYEMVGDKHFPLGLGDWIFAVPPFRDDPECDAQYLAHLRARGVPEAEVGRARTLRALVPAFLERAADEILAVGPRVVGFSTTFSQNVPSLVLARMLKRRQPSLAIVFGGGNCEGPMGAALHRAFPWIDVVVRGEAERCLPGLVRDLVAGRGVRPQPGLCYRDGTRTVVIPQSGAATVAMDEIPTPRFDEYFERLAKTRFATEVMREVRLPYETSRGCWWGARSHCTFCGLNGTTMAFRSKSDDRVVEELTALAQRHERLDFTLVDTILDMRYFRDVLPRLRDGGHDLSLYYETKSNLRREQVRLLREAGVDFLQPGIESLSTPILRLMRKGVTALQNVRVLKWCAEYGIQVFWNVIYGFPGEPPEEYARLAALVPSLTHLVPPTLCRLAIHRFSPYHERPAEFGLEVPGPLPWYRLVYPVDDATLADLAYNFDYRHADGRAPEAYVAPLRAAVEAWQAANASGGYRALRYRRGPGFLMVEDRRPNLEPADYSFSEREARLFLACEDGATAAEALAALPPADAAELDVDDVLEFLDELVVARLMYEEDGRYLSLALPARLPEHVGVRPS